MVVKGRYAEAAPLFKRALAIWEGKKTDAGDQIMQGAEVLQIRKAKQCLAECSGKLGGHDAEASDARLVKTEGAKELKKIDEHPR